MKKIIAIVCSFVLAVVSVFGVAGCFGGGDDKTDTTPKEYTIQYTDDSGVHTIKVTDGMPYSLEVVPSRTGYDFLGMYDAEEGGTQYISASGSSLAPFSDKKNMVLFPRYKAKDYTVILDYQGAPVTDSRQITVAYGSSLPELPQNLTVEHKEFAGWYTAAECGGTQIADEYGLIPIVSVLNEQNFDLSNSSLTLYAGFETEKHTVTFCFGTGIENEEVQVPYDTPISQVVPKTRVEGNAVLHWSKTQGGKVWNDKVASDIVLYAVEYAPVIEFDSNGGNEVTPVVARAGDTIVLPTPTKDLAKFSHWEDMSGNKFAATAMPAKSTTLKAVWLAKLVFDENGGSEVNDISQKAGTSIELPTPEKEGFIFAGWYNADKEQYASFIMPTEGIALKAGWYQITEKVFNLKDYTALGNVSADEDRRCKINLNSISIGTKIKIKVEFGAYIQDAEYPKNAKFNLYDGSYSTSNKIASYSQKITSTSESKYGYDVEWVLKTQHLYVDRTDGFGPFTGGENLYYIHQIVTITYPDTINLYL